MQKACLTGDLHSSRSGSLLGPSHQQGAQTHFLDPSIVCNLDQKVCMSQGENTARYLEVMNRINGRLGEAYDADRYIYKTTVGPHAFASTAST